MSGVNINAARCIEYLREHGVSVSDAEAASWLESERDTRARRRIAKAELKRSCGHFRTYLCRIVTVNGSWDAVTCWDCHRIIREMPVVSPPPLRRKKIPA